MKALPKHGALISGGLGDIGRAIALCLARNGANIALGDVAPEKKSRPFLKKLKAFGVKAVYNKADVSNPGAVSKWVRSAEKNIGIINLIIPNAAVVHLTGFKKLTPKIWNQEISVNLSGAFYVAQEGVKRLVTHKQKGRIVFIGSWAAEVPHIHIPAYCVCKAGIRILCKTMALEYAAKGILVNEVAPGIVDGGLSGKILKKNPSKKRPLLKKIPTGKLITPEEVAFEVAHLCNPESSQKTGTVTLLDGGLSLLS